MVNVAVNYRLQLALESSFMDCNKVKVKLKTLMLQEKDYFFYFENYEVFYGEEEHNIPEYPTGYPFVGKVGETYPGDTVIPVQWKTWINRAIYSEEGRNQIKKIHVYFIKHFLENLTLKLKQNGLPEYIEPSRAGIYYEVGTKYNLQNEGLENLIIFRKMWRLCYNEELYKVYKKRRKEQEEREHEEFLNQLEWEQKKSERYSWEDSYRDAGGGDEWSDPSQYWS